MPHDAAETETALKRTPLYDLHLSLGAKMVPFAGYEMPVQYPMGVMQEHTHTRQKAGLFDVSHMGQVVLRGKDYAHVATALEGLIPQNVVDLGVNRQRYGFFTAQNGGILDDLMFANREDHIFVVINAACKEADMAHLRAALADQDIHIKEITTRALIALQGPSAEAVLAEHHPDIAKMKFMDVESFPIAGAECWVSRSGYTGEDGFEISVPAAAAVELAKTLLAHDDVAPIGLGARDSLRLEAGLCLYGHDIDAQTTPVEAGLTWAIQKARKNGGARQGGFPGADVILGQLENGAARKRVGIAPQTRAPMREGTQIFANESDDEPVGIITSGGFGPSLGAPIAMGYVPTKFSTNGQELFAALRGKRLPVKVTEMPFVAANFKR